MRLFLAFLFILGPLLSQPKPPALSEQEKPIRETLRGLRKVPDNQRAEVTRKLARDIQSLPAGSPNRLALASALANLATEGDFGHKTLEDVAAALAGALRETPPPPQSGDYGTLAQLARYEGITVKFDDPNYTAAMQQLEEIDHRREQANFTATDLDGKQWTLRGLQGKVVLVNFWATWCPPCRKEMPDLEALYRKHKKKGLVVLALSDEEATKVRNFIAAERFSFPVLLDVGGEAAKQFVVEGIPKSFVFNREGKLAAQAIDMRTRGQFEAMLKKAGLE